MHAWTEELWQIATKEKFDRILCEKLAEKSRDIYYARMETERGVWGHTVHKILGLSPSKDVGEVQPAYCFACSTLHKANTLCPKPKDSEVWCEEIKLMPYGYYFKGFFLGCHVPDDWKQCPVCLAPRPKPKTLAEKFRDIDGMYDDSEFWNKLAEIAEKHFKDKL